MKYIILLSVLSISSLLFSQTEKSEKEQNLIIKVSNKSLKNYSKHIKKVLKDRYKLVHDTLKNKDKIIASYKEKVERTLYSKLNSKPIEIFELDSKKMVESNFNNLSEFSASTGGYLVAYFKLTQSNLIEVKTTNVVYNFDGTYKVGEFDVESYTNDLSKLNLTYKLNRFKDFKIYTLPFLNIVFYVKDNKCFSSYNSEQMKEYNIPNFLEIVRKEVNTFNLKHKEKLDRGEVIEL